MKFIKNRKQVDDIYDEEYSENIFIDINCGKEVNVFLLSGVKLTGELVGHDDRSVLLVNGNTKNMVYKSAISSISITR